MVYDKIASSNMLSCQIWICYLIPLVICTLAIEIGKWPTFARK